MFDGWGFVVRGVLVGVGVTLGVRVGVRESVGDGDLVGVVRPGEVYEYTDEKDGWYEIVLEDGEKGWISGVYVEPVSSE